MDQLRAAVDSHTRLHPEMPLLAFRHLVHLGVALATFIVRRTRRTNDRLVVTAGVLRRLNGRTLVIFLIQLFAKETSPSPKGDRFADPQMGRIIT